MPRSSTVPVYPAVAERTWWVCPVQGSGLPGFFPWGNSWPCDMLADSACNTTPSPRGCRWRSQSQPMSDQTDQGDGDAKLWNGVARGGRGYGGGWRWTLRRGDPRTTDWGRRCTAGRSPEMCCRQLVATTAGVQAASFDVTKSIREPLAQGCCVAKRGEQGERHVNMPLTCRHKRVPKASRCPPRAIQSRHLHVPSKPVTVSTLSSCYSLHIPGYLIHFTISMQMGNLQQNLMFGQKNMHV